MWHGTPGTTDSALILIDRLASLVQMAALTAARGRLASAEADVQTARNKRDMAETALIAAFADHLIELFSIKYNLSADIMAGHLLDSGQLNPSIFERCRHVRHYRCCRRRDGICRRTRAAQL